MVSNSISLDCSLILLQPRLGLLDEPGENSLANLQNTFLWVSHLANKQVNYCLFYHSLASLASLYFQHVASLDCNLDYLESLHELHLESNQETT